MMGLSIESVRRLYVRTGGKSFENHPRGAKGEGHVRDLISEGYVVKADGRCGFKRIRDGMLRWTPAAHAAFSSALSAALGRRGNERTELRPSG